MRDLFCCMHVIYNINNNIKIRVVPDLKFGLRIRTGSGFGLATGFRISGRIEHIITHKCVKRMVKNLSENRSFCNTLVLKTAK